MNELVQRVRSGQEVVLRESSLAFLQRVALPILMVFGAGLVLGGMKGGAWWAVPALGGAALVAVLVWLPVRKVALASVSPHGVAFAGQSYSWSNIESFGAGSAEYTPDWVFLTLAGGEIVSLNSTFGWKRDTLRDALNELLEDFNQNSARAEFEREIRAPVGSEARFRRPSGPDDALEQVRTLLASYYHPDCDTTTEVHDRMLRIAALDPHAFPLDETECAGCGSAAMKEVVISNGQTLHDAFRDMQRATPLKAQLGKFFLFSAILAPLGTIIGLSIPVAKNGWLLGFLGAGGGFLIGIVLSMLLYRPLRRAGYLW